MFTNLPIVFFVYISYLCRTTIRKLGIIEIHFSNESIISSLSEKKIHLQLMNLLVVQFTFRGI